MNACLCCGAPIQKRNEYGYCSRTPECRSRYQAAYTDAHRRPDAPVLQPCQSCGLPTTARSGYCKRTKTCEAAMKRAEYTAEKGHAKYKPGEPRRKCLECGKYLDLRVPVSVALCPTCSGTGRAQYRRALKAEVMAAYGGICACCGESNLDFLTIDHVNGDGAADRGSGRGNGGSKFYSWLRARGYPDRKKYQVLCFNCNCSKRSGDSCLCQGETRTAWDVLVPGQLVLF